MPYYGYYGGYGDFLANNIYCILLIPVLLLSLWAQAQVSGNFKRYSGVANRRRLTGAQAAVCPVCTPSTISAARIRSSSSATFLCFVIFLYSAPYCSII